MQLDDGEINLGVIRKAWSALEELVKEGRIVHIVSETVDQPFALPSNQPSHPPFSLPHTGDL
jgi:hypothetical protein